MADAGRCHDGLPGPEFGHGRDQICTGFGMTEARSRPTEHRGEAEIAETARRFPPLHAGALDVIESRHRPVPPLVRIRRSPLQA